MPPAAPLRVTGRLAEERPWRPHVTLARKRLPEPFDVPSLVFVPPSVTLLRSAGGRYEALATVATAE